VREKDLEREEKDRRRWHLFMISHLVFPHEIVAKGNGVSRALCHIGNTSQIYEFRAVFINDFDIIQQARHASQIGNVRVMRKTLSKVATIENDMGNFG
jgi:hypothetical protein